MSKNQKITIDDYVLTNVDLKTLCFKIRLKDNKEYIVYHKKINNKMCYFITKDGKEIHLSDEVAKLYLSGVREYQISGI